MGAFSMDTILFASTAGLCLVDFFLPIASSEITVEAGGQTPKIETDRIPMVFSTDPSIDGGSEIAFKAPFGLYIVALVSSFAAAGLSWFFSKDKGIPKSNMWFVIPPACVGALLWVIATICVWASDSLGGTTGPKASWTRRNFMTFFQAFLSWVGAALCGWATARIVIREESEIEGDISGDEGDGSDEETTFSSDEETKFGETRNLGTRPAGDSEEGWGFLQPQGQTMQGQIQGQTQGQCAQQIGQGQHQQQQPQGQHHQQQPQGQPQEEPQEYPQQYQGQTEDSE
jgi:hypothetical protein